MMTVMGRLWADDAGVILSAELVLVATILVLGMLVGLVTIRDSVVQELGDIAQAFGTIGQDYSFSAVSGHTSSTAGMTNNDVNDVCDTADVDDGVAGNCVDVTQNPSGGISSEGN